MNLNIIKNIHKSNMSKNTKKFVHRNAVCNKFLDVHEKNIGVMENNINMFQFSKKDDPVEILKEELEKPLFNYNNNTMDFSRNVKKKTTTKINFVNSNLLLSSNNIGGTKEINHIEYKTSSKTSLNQTSCRDQERIFGALIRVEGFMEFCKFNGINKEELTTIIPYIQIGKYSVGDYIFRTGESPNNFYCILNGKISILSPEIKTEKVKKDKQPFNEFESLNGNHTTNPNNNFKDEKQNKIAEIKKIPKYNKKISLIHRIYYSKDSSDEEVCDSDEEILEYESNEEKEKFVLNAGGCFGDWAIIYKQKRVSSAKVIENCECLLINSEIFYYCFSKKILKYENERRKFLKRKINIFEEDSAMIYDYFKRVKIYCTKKDEVIYNQNSTGDDFYLIYEGEFLLERKTTSAKTEEEKVREILNINKKINAPEKNIFKMYLNKGTFAGLEVIFNTDKKYEYTLKSISAFNIIFKINLKDFPELRHKITNYLHDYYSRKKDIINKLVGNKNKFFANKIYELQRETESNTPLNIQTKTNWGIVLKEPEEGPKHETITALFRKTAKSSSNKNKFSKLKRKKKENEEPKNYKEEVLFSNVISKERNNDITEKSEEKAIEKVEEKKINFSSPTNKSNNNQFQYEIKKNLLDVAKNGNMNIPKLKIFENFNKAIPNSSNKNDKAKFSYFSHENFTSFVNNNNTTTNSVNYLNENMHKNFSLYNFDFYNNYSKMIFDNIDSKLEKVKTSLDEARNLDSANNNFSNSSFKCSSLLQDNKNCLRFDKNKSTSTAFRNPESQITDLNPMIVEYKAILDKIASPDKKNINNLNINKTTRELNPQMFEIIKNKSDLKCNLSVMHNVKNSLMNTNSNSILSPNNHFGSQDEDSKKIFNKSVKIKIKLMKNTFKGLNKNSDNDEDGIIRKPHDPKGKVYNTNINFFSQSPQKSKKLLLDSERKEDEIRLSKIDKEKIYTQNNFFYNVNVNKGLKDHKHNLCKIRNDNHDIDVLNNKYLESIKNKRLSEKYNLNDVNNPLILNMNYDLISLKRPEQNKKLIRYEDKNV